MSRVKFPIDEKIFSFFAQAVNGPLCLLASILASFRSGCRETGLSKDPALRGTKRLSRFYRLGHPNVGPRFPAHHEHRALQPRVATPLCGTAI